MKPWYMPEFNVDNFNRPTQKLSWAKKTANKFEWFKQTANYYISQSGMFHYGNESYSELNQLYGVYNNEFPASWFTHITNPLAAKDPKHKRFPAKIRSTNILRTNIDQLAAEYHRRPFVYQVLNRGEDGYNRYTSELQQKIAKNLTEHFVALIQQEAIDRGLPVEEIPQPEDIPMPWEIEENHKISYKDALAKKGQKWLSRAIDEYRIRKKLRSMFLDWMIGGYAFSYKNIEHGDLVYERIDPRELDYDKSPDTELIEDGEWIVRRQWYTISDVVDKFYDVLKKEDLNYLETKPFLANTDTFCSHLTTIYGDRNNGKIPVYHCQWKARKEVKFIMGIDENGELTEEMVDEDHVSLDGQAMESEWVNEGYEVWRVGKDIFCNPRAIPAQRNSMNNFSKCKLSYNGSKYSPTTPGVFSIFRQGIPWQTLYIIVTYQLEMTIAKNKGKIVLIDKNAIPNKNGWDEEKFFWYSQASGWGLLNRNQPGVDKSWNQYTVLDLSTFKDIKELIELQNYIRGQWDLVTGFSDQRRGQVAASSQSGATSQAIFQNNLTTDLLFLGFEDFVETELQGLLDLSRLLNIDGVKGLYNGSTYDMELINIDPIPYCNADLGILLSRSPEEQEKVTIMKQLLQPLVQGGMPVSMVAEIINASNMADLKSKLAKFEELQSRQAEQAQAAEADQEARADKRLAAIEAMKNELKLQLQEHEYQWKERITLLEGQIDMNSAALLSKDETISAAPDVEAIYDRYLKQFELTQKERLQTRELAQRERESKRKAETDKLKARTALKNKVSGEK